MDEIFAKLEEIIKKIYSLIESLMKIFQGIGEDAEA